MADYWMKLYIEILDDPKMATLPDRVWRRIIELFLIAKRMNKGGHIPDTRQIAWMLRMNPDELESDMMQIAQTGIVEREVNGWYIPKFAKRQGASSSTERVQQFRKREQHAQYNADETDQKRFVAQSTETETETERETESAFPHADAGSWELPPPPAPADPTDYESLSPRQAERIPEIQTFREATGRMPGRPTYRTIIETIRQHRFAADDLRPYWTEWNVRGFRPENLAWLLEWAVNGSIPPRNGASKPVNSGPVYRVIN